MNGNNANHIAADRSTLEEQDLRDRRRLRSLPHRQGRQYMGNMKTYYTRSHSSFLDPVAR